MTPTNTHPTLQAFLCYMNLLTIMTFTILMFAVHGTMRLWNASELDCTLCDFRFTGNSPRRGFGGGDFLAVI